jgi:hypothetical protein
MLRFNHSGDRYIWKFKTFTQDQRFIKKILAKLPEYDWLIFKTLLGVILGGILDYSTSYRVIIFQQFMAVCAY